MQELLYGHLVDAMRETGVDATSPDFEAVVKPNWVARDTGKEWPQHARGHYEAHEDQLRLKNDSKGGRFEGKGANKRWIQAAQPPRPAGDIMSFQMPNGKFDLMKKYRGIHDQLVATVNRHGADIRAAAADLMQQKSKGGGVPGLAPKTTRYTLGMLGGGNVVVPDTHFVRYIFGLDKGKDGGKGGSIDYLKNLLWDEKHAPLLEAMDRYYGKHHDAVHHMLEHPRYKHVFEGELLSAGDSSPAFWKNWVSITPHERRPAAAILGRIQRGHGITALWIMAVEPMK